MTQLATFVRGSAAALLLSASLASMASATTTYAGPPLHLICEGGASETVCQAIAGALSAETQGRYVRVLAISEVDLDAVPLLIRYVEEHRAADHLSGHLAWRVAGGTTGTGPAVALDAMDAPLQAELLARFARQLVRGTRIPM